MSKPRHGDLHPGVSLLGHTCDRRGMRDYIRAPGSVDSSELAADGVVVEPYSVLDERTTSLLDARVGPFARLRPASVLLDGLDESGNFVELKKTVGSAPAPRPAISPIFGDADGRRSGANIGAGHRHLQLRRRRRSTGQTSATGAFIGSDTMLVAPVKSRPSRPPPAAGSDDHRRRTGRIALAVVWARQRNSRKAGPIAGASCKCDD